MTEATILNKTVWATLRPSPIHGIGVFAIRDIPAGTVLSTSTLKDLRKPKRLISMSEEMFHTILPEIKKLILDHTMFVRTPFTFYSPNDEVCLQTFMNHSDSPNSNGMIALRDIKQDEEITEDYRTLGFDKVHPISKMHNDYL